MRPNIPRFPLMALILAAPLGFGQAPKASPTVGKLLVAVNPVCANNWSNQRKGAFPMGTIPGSDAVLFVFGDNRDGVAIEKSGKLVACDQINNSGRPGGVSGIFGEDIGFGENIGIVRYGRNRDQATVYGLSGNDVTICDFPANDSNLHISAISGGTVHFTIGLNLDIGRDICWNGSTFQKGMPNGAACNLPVPLSKDVGRDRDNSSSPRIIPGRS